MVRSNLLRGTALASLALALLAPAQAFAAEEVAAQDSAAPAQSDPAPEADAQGSELEDIIVTARRSEENLQRVPVTVTALSADEIARNNIVSPQDLQYSTPSVSVANRLSRVGGGYTVRGLAAGVVSYFSEAPGGPTQIGTPFFDLASIQVLNGPQGTLFGRTAAAGAVLITPQHPDMGATGGSIDLTVGDYGRLQATAVANLVIVPDVLAVRAVYNHNHIRGFTEQLAPVNVIPGIPDLTDLDQRLDEVTNDSFRIAAELHLGRFKNYAVYNHLRINNGSPGQVLAYANPGLAALNPTAASFLNVCTTAFARGLVASVASCQTDRVAATDLIRANVIAEQARLRAGGTVRATPAYQGAGPQRERVRQVTFADIAEYDFGNLGFTTLRAKNVFSYQEEQGNAAYELDGVGGILLESNGATGDPQPAGAFQQFGNTAVAQDTDPTVTITEEFQLQGRAAGFLDWTLGYFHQWLRQPVELDSPTTLFRTFAGVQSVNRGWQNTTGFNNGSRVDEEAFFGQVTADLDALGVPGLSLTAGYRKTTSSTRSRVRAAVLPASGTGPLTPGAELNTDIEFSGTNYTFSINEQITPNILLYATHSKSFVPGGVNDQASNCGPAPSCFPTYSASTVKDYEVGLKTQFHLGTVPIRWNTNVYRMDFSNIQQTLRFGTATTTLIYIANVASARLQGFETSVDAVIGDFDLSLNYSNTDAKYTDWIAPDINAVTLPNDTCQPGSTPTLCLIDLSGSQFPNAPRHQLNGTLRYHLPIGDGNGDAWIMLRGYYQSRQWLTQAGRRELVVAAARGLGDVYDYITQEAYGTLAIRVGWDRIMGSNFSASVFVDNLTNETYATAGSTRAYSSGTAVRLWAPPRMFGLNVTYRFGI